MSYVGVLFKTLETLNYKSKLVPEINTLLNIIEFKSVKFFNITDILLDMDEIAKISDKIMVFFDQIFET